MKKKIFLLYLLTSSFSAIFSSEISARIISTEGYVEIQRDANIIKSNIVSGLKIEEADLIRTGSDGYVELEITSPVNTILLKINRGSALYFTENQTRTNNEVLLRVVFGEVEIKVDKVLLSDKANLLLKSAVLCTGDSEFSVVTAPERSLLVLCAEGSVHSRFVSGEVYNIGKGMALEMSRNRGVRSSDVGSENFLRYKNDWLAERTTIFRIGAFSITKPIITQYEEQAEKFNLIYDELVKYDQIFEKYKNGTRGFAESTVYEDRMKVNSVIFDMRSIFFQYEELFYSIAEIKGFHDISPIRGTLTRNYNIADFMNDFEKNYEIMVKKASRTRKIFAIYSEMDAGNFSTAIMEEAFSVNPLFN